MPATNIVRFEDIAASIETTLREVRNGVANVRKAGMLAEMPSEVKFNMVVVGKWQELEIVSQENGTNVNSSESSGVDTRSTKDESTKADTNTSTDTSSGNDTKTSTDTGTKSGSSSKNDHSISSTRTDK